MTAPRPQDPELLYREFRTHCATCASCRDQITPCGYGENLLMAWGESERFYANEAEMIDSTWGDEDSYPGSLGAA